MIEIRADAITCIGSREVNEDSYIMRNDGRGRFLFAVADGLGGHGRGEVASQAAMRAAAACFDRWDERMSMKDFLAETMWTAQNEIMRLQQEQGETNGMKTTCVILVINGDRAMWAHVGDSRLYWLIDGVQLQRTKDHSVPQMLVLQKDITEDQIRNHPDRNKLLRAMGNEWNKPKFDISEEYIINETTAFLLCTDGFWELIQEQEMVSIYRAADSPKKWLDNMLRMVQVSGVGKNMDNHTAVAVIAKPDPSAKNAAAQRQKQAGKKLDLTLLKQNKTVFIPLVAIILILLGVLVFLLINGNRDKEGDESETQRETISSLAPAQTQYAIPTTEAAQSSVDEYGSFGKNENGQEPVIQEETTAKREDETDSNSHSSQPPQSNGLSAAIAVNGSEPTSQKKTAE